MVDYVSLWALVLRGLRRGRGDDGGTASPDGGSNFLPAAGTIVRPFGFIVRAQLCERPSKAASSPGRVQHEGRFAPTARRNGTKGWNRFRGRGLVDAKKDRQSRNGEKSAPRRKRAVAAPDTHVAGALRSAYDRTVREDIPSELLDLLGKLG